jgi:hypothetical protein
MPVLNYFAATAPILLTALLLVSAYLEPNSPNTTATPFGINSAHAKTQFPADPFINEISIYQKLRARPIK